MNIPHQYQLFTAAESRDLDRRTIEEFGIDGFTLMEIAGTRAADFILHQFPNLANGLVLCGRGNNAGDALVVTRILSENGVNLTVFFVDGDQNLSPDCLKNYQLLKTLTSNNVEFLNSNEAFKKSYDFVIDGMLGTGLNSDIRSLYKEAIEQVNELKCTKFAMDIPT
ncbi:MAG: NAD(P)H-hydrate epimerase, partial [Balneolaceae bacterium]